VSEYVVKRFAYLDVAILDCLSSGPKTFGELRMSEHVEDEARRAAESGHLGSYWRLIDRRLQAMRKAGKIKYSRSAGWVKP